MYLSGCRPILDPRVPCFFSPLILRGPRKSERTTIKLVHSREEMKKIAEGSNDTANHVFWILFDLVFFFQQGVNPLCCVQLGKTVRGPDGPGALLQKESWTASAVIPAPASRVTLGLGCEDKVGYPLDPGSGGGLVWSKFPPGDVQLSKDLLETSPRRHLLSD